MKKVYLSSFLICFISLAVVSQSIERSLVSNVGGFSSNGGLQLDYSLGEPAIQSLETASLTLTQGFQQPSIIVSTIKNNNFSDILLYPNPVKDNVKIDISENYNEEFHYSLIDINGKLLMQGNLEKGENTIEMNMFSIGTYILRIVETTNMKEQQTKILKIK